MFNIFGQESGEARVYVPVTAEDLASMPNVLNMEGSTGGGETSLGVIIKWHYDGGITKTHGWQLNNKTITPDPNSIEETNKRVAEAASGMNLFQLMSIGECVVMM